MSAERPKKPSADTPRAALGERREGEADSFRFASAMSAERPKKPSADTPRAALGERREGEADSFRFASAMSAERTEDDIDVAVAEELANWQPVVSPLVAPVLALADECATAEEFLARLPEIVSSQNAEAFARRLALAMFTERVRNHV